MVLALLMSILVSQRQLYEKQLRGMTTRQRVHECIKHKFHGCGDFLFFKIKQTDYRTQLNEALNAKKVSSS